MSASVQYSPGSEQAGLQELLAAFPASTFAHGVTGFSNAALASPIFVVGLPRSGSTLLEQLLCSHSWVWAAGVLCRRGVRVPACTHMLCMHACMQCMAWLQRAEERCGRC